MRTRVLPGTNYREVLKAARDFYSYIKKKTKRRPYVRSAYFSKDKVFLELFWQHLQDKLNHRDKARRLRLFPAAVELIEKSMGAPDLRLNPNRKTETLYRFRGKLIDGSHFIVQIKEDPKGHKWLMSVFPE